MEDFLVLKQSNVASYFYLQVTETEHLGNLTDSGVETGLVVEVDSRRAMDTNVLINNFHISLCT